MCSEKKLEENLHANLFNSSVLPVMLCASKVESPRCVVANVLDCDVVVSKFEPQSHYYVHFRTMPLNKETKPIYKRNVGYHTQKKNRN